MLDDIMQERQQKLAALKQEGIDPYPARIARTMTIGGARSRFRMLRLMRKKVSLVGRVVSMRDSGALLFLDIKDETGQLQAVFKKNTFKQFKLFKDTVDRGDFVGVSGLLFKTKRGEISVEVRTASIITKALRPLPSQWYGLEETELRLRQRYLDLLMNWEVREMFIKKAVFWDTFRQFLKKEGFLEVELPVLEALPGGAEAEPFKTHHNALDTDFYLRISLELPLKKLLVAGYEKVFEVGRIFRNEGIDRDHLQDYTQLEFYWAYHDYNDLMKLLEKMYKQVIKATVGSLTTTYEGQKIDWGKKWPKVYYAEAFKKENNGLDVVSSSIEQLYERARALGLKPEPNLGRGRLIDLIYKKTVRPKLVQPCFLIDPPVVIEPLAKRRPDNPDLVERLQIVAGGTELGKGFSELNDPMDQRGRFEDQMRLREAGDKEAQFLDEDFLTALEYGMPPATGFGMSERLFSVLMDKPVRETTIFPLMRPKAD